MESMKLAAKVEISVSEFWEMTPVELNIYANEYFERQKNDFKERLSLEYYNSKWTIQWLGDKKGHPKPLDDILDNLYKGEDKEMTADEMLAQVKILNSLFGGKIVAVS